MGTAFPPRWDFQWLEDEDSFWVALFSGANCYSSFSFEKGFYDVDAYVNWSSKWFRHNLLDE